MDPKPKNVLKSRKKVKKAIADARIEKRTGLYVPGKAGITKAPKEAQKQFKTQMKAKIRGLKRSY